MIKIDLAQGKEKYFAVDLVPENKSFNPYLASAEVYSGGYEEVIHYSTNPEELNIELKSGLLDDKCDLLFLELQRKHAEEARV